jgi:hypothetical protein
MQKFAINTHSTLFRVLFAIFEIVFVTSLLLMVTFDDGRKISAVADLAGVGFYFGFVGLVIVSLLLRRVAPRVSALGLVTAISGIAVAMLLLTI